MFEQTQHMRVVTGVSLCLCVHCVLVTHMNECMNVCMCSIMYP